MTRKIRELTGISLGHSVNVKYVLLGLSNAIAFRLIGLLIIAEILIVVQLMAYFLSKRQPLNHEQKIITSRILFFGIIWFTTQLFTDFYRESAGIDTVKSLSQIFVLTGLILALITCFQNEEKRLVSYLYGYSLSYVLIFVESVISGTAGDWWKFYFGPSLSILFLIFIGRLKIGSKLKFCLVSFLGFFSIALGSRSLGLILIITAIGLLNYSSSRSILRSLIFILVFFLLANAGNNLIREASLTGKLGRAQQIKAQQQYSSGPIILVARSELTYQLASIVESPIFGFGSNPSPSREILINTYDIESKYGIISKNTAAYESLTKTGKTPQHSIIFGAWLEGGVIAIILLIYLFLQMLKWDSANRVRTSKSKLSLLARYLHINFLWAIFFSPLGAGSRMNLAITIGVCFLVYRTNLSKDSRDVGK